MKKLLLMLVLVCLPAFGQKTEKNSLTATASDCATSSAACLVINLIADVPNNAPGIGSLGIDISGTFTATVTFEGSVDGGTTWRAVNVTPVASSTKVSTATSGGAWRVAVGGFTHFRARCSAFTSGTIVVSIRSAAVSAGLGGGTDFTSGGTTADVVPESDGSSGLRDSPIITDNSVGFRIVEGTAPSGTAGSDVLYADSTAHRWKFNNNNGGADTVAGFTDKLSVFAATTSAELAGVLSNETGGSGLAVFNSSPTIITPSFTTGFTIGGAAALGNRVLGDGTNFVSSAPDTQTDIIGPNIQPLMGSATTAAISNANEVRAMRFYLGSRVTITKVDFRIGTGAAASFVSAGIYNSAGTTLLVDSGPVDTSANGVKSTTITSVTLQPGTYWFAYTATTATTLTGVLLPVTITDTSLTNAGAGKAAYGTAANASSAGQLPSALGNISLGNISGLMVHFY